MVNRYSYDRTAREVSPPAQNAFDHEVMPRMIRHIMEKAQSDIRDLMGEASDGKWPNDNVEYSVMRHKPLSMSQEDFTKQLMSAYINWSRTAFPRE